MQEGRWVYHTLKIISNNLYWFMAFCFVSISIFQYIKTCQMWYVGG